MAARTNSVRALLSDWKAVSQPNAEPDRSWDQIGDHIAKIVAGYIRSNPPVPTPWFAPDDAAAYLRLTRRGLEDMRAKATGPRYHKVNDRVVRYHVRDLDAWLQSDGGERG